MKTISFFLMCCIMAICVSAQPKNNGQSEPTYKSMKVGDKTFLYEEKTGSIVNKDSNTKFEEKYRGKNKGIDPNVLLDATNNLKIRNSNVTVVSAIKSVFSTEELNNLRGEKLPIIVKINNQGQIFYVNFLVRKNQKLKDISISTLSIMEDKMISSIQFKVINPEIEVYTLVLTIDFDKIYYGDYLFPKKMYCIP